MNMFKKIMALLVLSMVLAGCNTPFVDVEVNGENFSKPHDGAGACFWPCYCPHCGGGATFEGSGQDARVLFVDENQKVFHLQGEKGQTIRVILPSASSPDVKPGAKVKVVKESTGWDIKP